jgi:superfamily I DNA/RNA helicase
VTSHETNLLETALATNYGWMRRFLDEHDAPVTSDGTFEERRQQTVEAMAALVNKRSMRDLYEAILVDEAQDCLPMEIQLFCRLGKRLFAVADSRQKIYDGPDPLGVLRGAVDDEQRLRYHYRNGLKICRLADDIAKESDDYEPMASTSHYDEELRPSSVTIDRCRSLKEQMQLVTDRIDTQVKAYPTEYIGIVTPRRRELKEIVDYMDSTHLAKLVIAQREGERYVSFANDRHIVVCTLHAAKGLEFRALHIVGCEYVRRFFRKQRNMTYTAVTRAKTSLNIYHSDDLPAYLEQAYANLSRPPDLPDLDDLFQKEAD